MAERAIKQPADYAQQTMDQAAPLRASDFIQGSAPLKAEDIQGEDVLLLGMAFLDGQFGPYVSLTIEKKDGNGETIHPNVTCGGGVILRKAEELRERIEKGECAYPLIIQFVKAGVGERAYWDWI